MRHIIIITLSLVSLLSSSGFSQDIHFSQFYNSPLTLNPAMTGRTNGDFRVNLNYRNQWFGLVDDQSTFVTPAISFDMPFQAFKNDVVGGGVMVMNDRSSGGNLTNLTAMVSGAYHKTIGGNGRNHISLGVQAGFVQRQLDEQNLSFANQIGDDFEFNDNLSSGENFDGDDLNYLDLNVGLLWTSTFSDHLSAYAGGAIFHVTEPEQNFANEGSLSIPSRWVGHGGLDVGVTEKLNLLPSFIFMTQNEANEVNAGLSGAYDLSGKTTVYLGGYYRVEDAAIVYSALEWNNIKVGLSYDATVSDLQSSGGSVELSLTYIRKTPDVPDVKPKMYCPRF